MVAGICVCCMKLTKRSVQLAFDPAHRVFPERNSQNSSSARARERAFSNMKASKVTRTLPAVQKGIFERTKVRIFGEGRAEWTGQRLHKVWQRLGKTRSTRSWGLRLVFDAVFSLGRHLSICCLFYTSRFRARRFEELDSIVMDVGGAIKMGLAEVVLFLVAVLILDSVFCFFQSSALLLISKGKALIQLFVSTVCFLCFHLLETH